ncbi:MAG: hypothetical protein KDE28_11700 [Anaerolineales bacterium]|nr:hypothetical protein [Anaerolineales bacterium]
MPEYPDITVYVERLEHFLLGQPLKQLRIKTPFLLRTYEPAPETFTGRTVTELGRLGKRIIFGFEGDFFMALHLMINGRLHWQKAGAIIPAKRGLAALDFPHGTLLLTESTSQKRAALHLVQGREALAAFNRGGVNVLTTGLDQFTAALRRENHTLKRSLTDPRLIDGIGNAYSDEILHRAGLSPFLLTSKITDDQIAGLYEASRGILLDWTERLRQEVGDGFPARVTAFHEAMAVHGKYGQPCPVCGTPIQRIKYASSETNYCPTCQTGGRLLADRALSRLLKQDWPRTPEELEAHIQDRRR